MMEYKILDNLIVLIRYRDNGDAIFDLKFKGKPLAELLFSELSPPNGYEISWYLESLITAYTNKTSIKLGGESYGFTIDIDGPLTKLILLDPNDPKKYSSEEYPTDILIDTMHWWGELQVDASHYMTFRKDWHGIPTHKDNPTEDDAMYYDPQAGKTGLWKDVKKDWQQDKTKVGHNSTPPA